MQQFSARLGIEVSDLLTRVPDIGRYLYARKDQITVLSPHGNVQYTGRDVSYEELPNDPKAVFVNVPGANGRLVTITLNADVLQNPSLQQVNKILIQGSDQDRDWVNGQYEWFRDLVSQKQKVFRNFVYQGMRLLGLGAFVALSCLEFKLFQFFRPAFSFQTPLTGLSVLLTFLILWVNNLLVFTFGSRVTMYLYPYFELEDHLSEQRKDWRKWWKLTVAAIYTGGVWAFFTIIL